MDYEVLMIVLGGVLLALWLIKVLEKHDDD